MAPFAALVAVVLVWGLVSGRLARYSITLPIVLVAMGAVLSATQVVVVELDSEAVRILVELALSILLFADATEITARWLRSAGRLPLRMLALGFPLTVATGFAAGYFLLPGLSVWIVALLAAALAATDAALASPVIMDERIPRRLRRIIDVESGLNDGLATPLVLFFLAGAVASGGPEGGEAPLVHALVELAIGVAVGVVIGAGGARLLLFARRTSLSSAAGERLAVLALPVLTYLTAVALGGNGFVAGFVAGIAAGTVGREEVAEERLQLTNDVGTLVSAAVWFVFGSLIPGRRRAGGLLECRAVRATLTDDCPHGAGGTGPGAIRSRHPRGVVPRLDRTAWAGLDPVRADRHRGTARTRADHDRRICRSGDRGDRGAERAVARVDRGDHRGPVAYRSTQPESASV